MNLFNNEEFYIFKRKAKAFFHSLVYYACRIFPIKKNKIVLWTFECSGGFGCSPKYIAEEILRRKAKGENDFELYWLLDDMEKEFPREIKKVKNSLWARAYHLSTARFWIANTRSFLGTVKRSGTTYIQTWHGTVSIKPIGKYRGDSFSKIAYIISKADSDLIDYFLCGSEYRKSIAKDGMLYYNDPLMIGTPRIDVLINSVEKKKAEFRSEYNLPQDAKIMLYAPTFRGGSQNTVRNVNATPVSLDFDRLLNVLAKKFGGEWYIFLRLHPQLAAKMRKMPVANTNERLIDVSQRPDMNEIMAATDAMITDYSSAIFEGFLTGQYGFIYADDLEEYIKDRGKLMFSLDEIPFSVAYNNDELIENIVNFDEKLYAKKCKAFIEKVGIIEDGKAGVRAADLIEKLADYDKNVKCLNLKIS